MSIPMFISEDIVGKRFLELEAVVELLKDDREKDNLFTEFPIGTTMQDGGKRKRSGGHVPLHCLKEKRKRKEKQNQYKIRKIK